jgi:hypothetical protein
MVRCVAQQLLRSQYMTTRSIWLALALACTQAPGLVQAQSTAEQTTRPAVLPPADEPPPRSRYNQLVLDGGWAVSGQSTTGDGGGGALRFGLVYPTRFMSVIPEAAVDFFAFSGTRTAQLYGALGGLRLRFGRGFEPGMAAHFGVAGVSRGESYAAPVLDVGLSADFTYFERLLLGIQGIYGNAFGVNGHSSFTWYTAGISVGTKL